MEPLDVALLATAAPVATWLGVSGACGGLSLYAVWRGRRDPQDDLQRRALAGAPAGVLRGAAWMLVEGFWQTVALVLQVVALLRPRRRVGPLPRVPDATPVVLVAGYLENWGTVWVLGRRLRARGHLVVHLDLPSTLARIADNAAWLRGRVDEVLAATGARRVALVGHSMGGVIARTLVLDDPAAPVACVVSIASPHRGTHLGRLGPGRSARDMSPGSDHLARTGPERVGAAPVHSVFGVLENIVSPAWSCVVAGGEVEVLDCPCGHVAPLFLRRVADRVDAWLRAAAPAPASSAPPHVPVAVAA